MSALRSFRQSSTFLALLCSILLVLLSSQAHAAKEKRVDLGLNLDVKAESTESGEFSAYGGPIYMFLNECNGRNYHKVPVPGNQCVQVKSLATFPVCGYIRVLGGSCAWFQDAECNVSWLGRGPIDVPYVRCQ